MTEGTESGEEIVSFLLRHVVPLYLRLEQLGQRPKELLLTAFILEVSEEWFLITAGHAVRDIKTLLDNGWNVVSSRLIDTQGFGSRHRVPIVFDYANSQPIYFNPDAESNDYDYAVIHLSVVFRNQLESNNVQPLSEDVWKYQPPQVDFYWMLGIPSESVQFTQAYIGIRPLLVKVEKLETRPELFHQAPTPIFYGRVTQMPAELTSINGMSGAPIFGFKKIDGQLKYWLIAVQSAWLPRSKMIAAWPTTGLALFLEEKIREWREMQTA